MCIRDRFQPRPANAPGGQRKFRGGGSPGNSIHDGNTQGPYGQRPPQGPRHPRGGSPGNSIHDGKPSGERRPGGGNKRRGPRPPR